MRLKHNKKRNTAFVYEALIRELTKSIIKQNKNRSANVKNIIKEHFSKDKHLHLELEIYQSLCAGEKISRRTAEKLMLESRIQYESIDKRTLFREKSSLINKINKILSPNVFNNFVPNYKNLATVYSMFNANLTPRDKIILEEKIIDSLVDTAEDEAKEMKPIDGLIYTTFVNKFNDKYSSTLAENQKNLLGKFISSFADDGLELKVFVNEEIGRLRNTLVERINNEEISSDEELKEKMQGVIKILESFSKYSGGETALVEKLLRIQKLEEELEKEDGN